MDDSTAEIEKQLEELRGSENFIGFSAFDLFLDDDENRKKVGVLKISRHNHTPDTGFLKFTFIVDVYGDKDIREQVLAVFARFQDTGTDSEMDPNFMYIRPSEPAYQKDKAWFIGEVFFHFDSANAASKKNVVGFFIPFLTLRLPIEFRDLDWWDDDEENNHPQKKSAIKSITDFIKSKF
ncbi:MAG: hypothetical protein BA863_12560 [Desulfovibrio sp. S3730MH75]|nr:MAG: hypothetical protein BA863_12560 [Desulfovibrio sp. S3730MH75]